MAVTLARRQQEAVERLLPDGGLRARKRSREPEPEAVCVGWCGCENAAQDSG
jgi:hypothetical protein